MAFLTTTRKLKNTDWLLRNWKLVQCFEVMEASDGDFEAFLTAYIKGFSSYDCFTELFKTKLELWGFLNKPVFFGIRINWFGNQVVSGKNTMPEG